MKKIIYVFITLSLIGLAGCQNNAFTGDSLNNLPKQQFLVGGGFEINYIAPQDGTVLLVAKNKTERITRGSWPILWSETIGKIISTKTLNKGQSFDLNGMDPKMFEQTSGISMNNAILELYFIPYDKIENSLNKPCN